MGMISQKIRIKYQTHQITTIIEFIKMEYCQEVFDDNIYEFIKEMIPLTDCYKNLFEDVPLEDFNKDKYKIELCVYDYPYKDEDEKENLYEDYYLKCESDYLRCEGSYYPDFYCNTKLGHKYAVYSEKVKLWFDPNDIEDGGYMLDVLNTYKMNYYKNKLGNDLLYFVEQYIFDESLYKN